MGKSKAAVLIDIIAAFFCIIQRDGSKRVRNRNRAGSVGRHGDHRAAFIGFCGMNTRFSGCQCIVNGNHGKLAVQSNVVFCGIRAACIAGHVGGCFHCDQVGGIDCPAFVRLIAGNASAHQDDHALCIDGTAVSFRLVSGQCQAVVHRKNRIRSSHIDDGAAGSAAVRQSTVDPDLSGAGFRAQKLRFLEGKNAFHLEHIVFETVCTADFGFTGAGDDTDLFVSRDLYRGRKLDIIGDDDRRIGISRLGGSDLIQKIRFRCNHICRGFLRFLLFFLFFFFLCRFRFLLLFLRFFLRYGLFLRNFLRSRFCRSRYFRDRLSRYRLFRNNLRLNGFRFSRNLFLDDRFNGLLFYGFGRLFDRQFFRCLHLQHGSFFRKDARRCHGNRKDSRHSQCE